MHAVNLIYTQIQGLHDGYQAFAPSSEPMTYDQIIYINYNTDLDDVMDAIIPNNDDTAPGTSDGSFRVACCTLSWGVVVLFWCVCMGWVGVVAFFTLAVAICALLCLWGWLPSVHSVVGVVAFCPFCCRGGCLLFILS